MSTEASSKKLSRMTKAFYGIGDLGNAVVNSAIQFFLMKFYTDGAHVAPALAGNALLIGKFWDAINDPLFGWITDKTNSDESRDLTGHGIDAGMCDHLAAFLAVARSQDG